LLPIRIPMTTATIAEMSILKSCCVFFSILASTRSSVLDHNCEEKSKSIVKNNEDWRTDAEYDGPAGQRPENKLSFNCLGHANSLIA
jgi:hypothetical protein